jgi:hypothetical protein
MQFEKDKTYELEITWSEFSAESLDKALGGFAKVSSVKPNDKKKPTGGTCVVSMTSDTEIEGGKLTFSRASVLEIRQVTPKS